jgi:hypothetical protein
MRRDEVLNEAELCIALELEEHRDIRHSPRGPNILYYYLLKRA